MRGGLPALALVVAVGCFEYSPHAIVLDPFERHLHEKAVARLEAAPAHGMVRFAVVGDTELAYDEATLVAWYRNTATLRPTDVFTLALGIRLGL